MTHVFLPTLLSSPSELLSAPPATKTHTNRAIYPLYKKLNLTDPQKRNLFYMLQDLKTLEGVETLRDFNYQEIESVMCCPDKKCVCGSKMEEIMPEEIYMERPEDVKKSCMAFYDRGSKTHDWLVSYHEKLEELKANRHAVEDEYKHWTEMGLLRELAYYKQKLHDLYLIQKHYLE